MKKLFPLFALAFVALALVPFSANAGGLIPCGGVNPDGTNQSDCGLCHVFVLGGNIINFFLYPNNLNNNFAIVPIVATILIVVGGFLLITAGGDPNRLEKAKSVLTAVVVGLIIIYAADLLLKTMFTAIGVLPTFELKSWTNTASWCPVK